MSTIDTAIVIEPCQALSQATDDIISISVQPRNSFTLRREDPEVSSTSNTQTTITGSNWYIQGITIFGTIDTSSESVLDLVFHRSALLSAGIVIRVIAVSGEIHPHLLHFPPGSLNTSGQRVRLNFSKFIQQVLIARAINQRPSPN